MRARRAPDRRRRPSPAAGNRRNRRRPRARCTGSPQQASCSSWKGETRPLRIEDDGAHRLARPSAAQPTAPPVSPEVAASTVSGSPPSPSRSKQAIRKRAPKSLNAPVGPWNSSSARRPGRAGSGVTSGAGKSNASRADRGQLGVQRIAGEEGREHRARRSRRSGSLGVQRGRIDAGIAVGQIEPAVGRGAVADRLAQIETGGAPPRVLTNFMRRCRSAGSTPLDPDARRNRPARDRRGPSRPAAAKAAAIASSTASASLLERPGEDRRARAGEGAAERAGAERRRLHRRQRGQQMRALRLDQQILEAGADQAEIAGRAAGDEGGEPAAMLDRERHRHLGARAAAAPPRSRSRTAGWKQDRDDAAGHRQAVDDGRLLAARRARGRRTGWPTTLSQGGGSEETRSPSSAKGSRSSVANGSGSSALTAAAPATAEAAEPPMPAADRHALVDRQAHAEVRAGGVEHRLGGGQRGIASRACRAGCRRGR